MILVSSSGDHFDCFFAGDCCVKSVSEAGRFNDTEFLAVTGTWPVPVVVPVLDGADVTDWETDAGDVENPSS